ncbi:uncharacterized protein LOC130442573 isoform X1 [Diorhabda sublineata]|uniref:uncharacterized protein LOC130442573 isoform X1 n=2 Tax=Diorhabda sublineata TaxID=1163346 RepID=UPI0024E09C5D|nr:uncharacterized protein LOC130442573 isoform X1 [Diorhabda sublineata]
MSLRYLLISLPVLPAYLIFLMCLVIYKYIIFAILKMKYNKNLSPIESIDSFFTLGEFQDNFSNILITMETDIKEKSLQERIIKHFERTIIKNTNHFRKIHSSVHSYMGFSFLLREEIQAADFVNIIDVNEDSYEYLNHFIYEYCMKPLPKHNKLLMDATILKCGNNWKMKNNFRIDQIPVLFRIHHILGDGLSIMNLFIQLFGDDKLVIDEVIGEFHNRHKYNNFWMRLLEDVYSFLILPGFMICEVIRRCMNNRVFIGSTGSGKQYFAKKVGDDTMSLQKIKALKKKIGNCRFTEILIAAISASLCDYFRKKNGVIPKTVAAVEAVVQEMVNLNQNGLPELKNQFKFFPFEIPIEIGSDSMLKRLNAIRNYTRSPDSTVIFMMQRLFLHNLMGLLPRPFIEMFFKTKYTSLALSNLPGIKKITLFNGIKIEEIYFFVLGRKETGMGYSLITYDNKMHLAFKAHDNIISSQEDCQKLVDDVFKYLNELSKELSDKSI